MIINLNSTMNYMQLKKTHWNSSERPKADKNNFNRIFITFHNFHDAKWQNSNSLPSILSPPSTTSYLRTSIPLLSRQIQNIITAASSQWTAELQNQDWNRKRAVFVHLWSSSTHHCAMSMFIGSTFRAIGYRTRHFLPGVLVVWVALKLIAYVTRAWKVKMFFSVP